MNAFFCEPLCHFEILLYAALNQSHVLILFLTIDDGLFEVRAFLQVYIHKGPKLELYREGVLDYMY